ncbi:hypothetical protein AGMMS49975_24040 [Clostridia bacterium]|nr:hypothetical protein AGMMS49975_24040 [Clostridia bacterium]
MTLEDVFGRGTNYVPEDILSVTYRRAALYETQEGAEQEDTI